MKSIKKYNIIEPDFNSELEEVAEIPEKVSAGTEVDGGHPSPREEDGLIAGSGDLEERAVPLGAHEEPMIIVDEYAGEHNVSGLSRAKKRQSLLKKELTVGDASARGDEFDVGSVAAEIDALVKREPIQAPKTGPEPGPARRADNEEDMPLVSRHMDFMDTPEEDDGSVAIDEDDDIDLDYYSLDELKSGMTDPLESFEFTPPVKEPPPPREETAEPKNETRGKAPFPREPVKKKKRAVKENTITIEIPEDLRKKLPKGFSMDDLGIIDLREAEAIANEGIILLTEDELIDELEEFDLMPGEIGRPSDLMDEAAGEETEYLGEEEEADQPDEPGEAEFLEEAEGPVRVLAREEILEESPRSDAAAEEIIEAGGVKAEADERLSGADGKETEQRKEQPVPREEARRVMESAEDEKELPAIPVGDHRPEPEENEDLRAVDESFTAVEEFPVAAASTEPPPSPKAETAGDTVNEPFFEETIEIDRRYAKKETSAGEVEDFREALPAETEPVAEESEPVMEEIEVIAKPPVERASLMVREVLPPQLLKPREGDGAVRFIDDVLVETPEDQKDSTLTVDELERISSEIIQVVEGDAMLLAEGDSYDDFTRVAGIMRGSSPAFEDLLQDLNEEQVYRDDEIGFVSSVFEAEDYGDYIKTIDEKPGRASGRKESSAVEIIGLEKKEISELENSVFMKEYEKINIEEALGGIRPGMDQPRDDVRLLKRCRFIMTRPDSLSPEERKSIEEDVLSDTALVYEENVDQVKERLDALKKHQPHSHPGTALSDAVVVDEASAPSVDISNKVFIIDDKTDLERFFSTIPEDKRENLAKLLKYLDGLFEKLPEEVIRNFASSEYFDIYTKVLNDLGV
ncbi:MAG TPA: hypothetical protein ENN21_05920 [Spirochaetes bacterium]|nr:hypothetical protein [Spirochaetota bacterium]